MPAIGGIKVALFAVALLAFSATPGSAAEIQLAIDPDTNPDPKRVTVWENFSQTDINSDRPIQWATPWQDTDNRRDLEIRAFWPDATEFIGLKILIFNTGHRIDVPLQRPDVDTNRLAALSSECANSAATAFNDVIADYFKCRAVFRKSPPDSSWRIKAAKGWFDSAYKLSTFEKSPFGRDSEIERIMQNFEDRTANDSDWTSAWTRRYRAVVKEGYVKRFVTEARSAELNSVRYVRPLANAGQLQAALSLNAYAREIFDSITQETGATVVNGVSADTFAKNEAYIRSRMGTPANP